MIVDILYRESGGEPGDYVGRVLQVAEAGSAWGPAVGKGRALLEGVEVTDFDVEQLKARRLFVRHGELVHVSRKLVGARQLVRAKKHGWGPKPYDGCPTCGGWRGTDLRIG